MDFFYRFICKTHCKYFLFQPVSQPVKDGEGDNLGFPAAGRSHPGKPHLQSEVCTKHRTVQKIQRTSTCRFLFYVDEINIEFLLSVKN